MLFDGQHGHGNGHGEAAAVTIGPQGAGGPRAVVDVERQLVTGAVVEGGGFLVGRTTPTPDAGTPPAGAMAAVLVTHDREEALALGDRVVVLGRGGVLAEERIAGAAFDVFAQEPPTDYHLMRLPNFLATPHIGGSTDEAILAMGRAAIDGLDEHWLPVPEQRPTG